MSSSLDLSASLNVCVSTPKMLKESSSVGHSAGLDAHVSTPKMLKESSSINLIGGLDACVPTPKTLKSSSPELAAKKVTKRTIEAHLLQDRQTLQSLSSLNTDLLAFMQSRIDHTVKLLSDIHGSSTMLHTVSDLDGSQPEDLEAKAALNKALSGVNHPHIHTEVPEAPEVSEQPDYDQGQVVDLDALFDSANVNADVDYIASDTADPPWVVPWMDPNISDSEEPLEADTSLIESEESDSDSDSDSGSLELHPCF
ncbi:hypothetical protein EI94DRAFT_1799790 [Lactarius quietus]|nr:hypothetical protein EI94DRAFT_1799790 [Lactarius quietus]